MAWLSALIFIGVAFCIGQLVYIERHRPKTTAELLASMTARMGEVERAIETIGSTSFLTAAQVRRLEMAWDDFYRKHPYGPVGLLDD